MADLLYVPILKGREGEYGALEQLDPETRSQITPLIELPPIPYDYVSESPAKSLQEHVADLSVRLTAAMGERPFYLDLGALSRDDEGESILPLTAILQDRLSPWYVIPVITRGRSVEYVEKACELASTEQALSVRLVLDDFDDEIDLPSELEYLLLPARNKHFSVDLVVDLGDLSASVISPSLIARSALSMVPRHSSWRRIILAGASFPEDLSDVSAATTVSLPRREWDLWRALRKRPDSLPFQNLIFSDYAVANPKTKILDPRTMRMSASIRYTTDQGWLIIKGRNVRQYGFEQYFALARALRERDEYDGPGFSWGDRYIDACANTEQGPGNATTWRKVGVNHHITLVAKELATMNHAASGTIEPSSQGPQL